MSAPNRQIKLQNGCISEGPQFTGNAIKTSKYTTANFVPMNLWEQLHKFGNVYFLMISVLMYLGEKTTLFIGTIKAFSTLATLMMMMSVTALVAHLDDKARKKADRETNSQKARRFTKTGKIETTTWEDLRVGDVLIIEQDHEIPADVVVVYSSTEKGNCFVSTANLDGETNLKLKNAPPATQAQVGCKGATPEEMQEAVFRKIQSLAIDLDCEAPNNSIYNFNGRLRFSGADESLEFKHILLRGTVLRNTPWCCGIIAYTGGETRMVMNSRPAPMKQSNLERVTNNVMLVILGAQAALAMSSNLIYQYKKADFASYWYLYPPDLILPDILAYWLTFFVLYSNMMPISLYPTMEACNSAQSYFIKNDKEMYYRAEDMEFQAGVRSTNLCQEIGQVKFVFSDKTGTLTQNVMELKKISIVGEVFGTLVEGQKGFNGAAAMNGRRSTPEVNAAMDNFLEVLSVSHTAQISQKEGKRTYEVESPDEGALVEGAAQIGWAFERREAAREGEQISVRVNEQSRQYTVLAVNEFNSTRKRFSCLVKYGDKITLLAKGADNVMLERATKKDELLERHLTSFSVEGLRTLVFARRELTNEECSTWQAKYNAAMRLMGTDREDALDRAAEDIEKNLVIVGATAIEDKLQDGVPDTIVKVREAGVKLWVLTGDKLETAQNIGFSSKVLTNAMELVIIDASGSGVESILNDKMTKINAATESGKDSGIMITGAALDAILPHTHMRKTLMSLGLKVSVLIACRVSPLQKAELVKMVRSELPDVVTLAIGDGANDVPMIQEAHVGIGIAGREGRQAVNNSDFAIGQFRYLQRLMLVHGRWNYRRVCKFTLFTFWRNAVQVLMIFYYTFISGFSGTSLFEDWIRLSFNFLCSFPIMATGCFDQDVSEKVALMHPELYSVGREGKDLNPLKIFQTLLSAITHSLILLGLTCLAFPSMDIHGAGDYYTFGTAVYSCLLVDMNYRAAFITVTHNRYTIGSICASFCLYALYLVVYPCNRFITDLLAPNMYMVPVHMVKHSVFWMTVVAVPALAITVDMFIVYCFQTFDFEGHRIFELVVRQGDSDYNLINSLPDDKKSKDDVANLEGKIDLSDFAQQSSPSTRFFYTGSFLRRVLLGVGFSLAGIGAWALYASASATQIRVHYEGPDGYDPWGTNEFEVIRAQKDCEHQRSKGPGLSTCKIDVKLQYDMHPPILLYYAIGPFYQNFNDYLKSEVPKELHGQVVPEGLRETMCTGATRVDQDGNDIVPCGMKATSVFNDTFKIHGYDIDNSGLAWKEDLARFQNPPDYLKRDKTSWLYERYPDVVDKDEGVNNEQFLVWMRPSALQRVWNPYGVIKDKVLKKGETITLSIESNYPMDQMGGWKQIVLTTVGTMGGRHHGFGYCLCGSAAICFILFFVSLCIEDCGKRSNQQPTVSTRH